MRGINITLWSLVWNLVWPKCAMKLQLNSFYMCLFSQLFQRYDPKLYEWTNCIVVIESRCVRFMWSEGRYVLKFETCAFAHFNNPSWFFFHPHLRFTPVRRWKPLLNPLIWNSCKMPPKMFTTPPQSKIHLLFSHYFSRSLCLSVFLSLVISSILVTTMRLIYSSKFALLLLIWEKFFIDQFLSPSSPPPPPPLLLPLPPPLLPPPPPTRVVATAKSGAQKIDEKNLEALDFTKVTLHQAKRLEMDSQVTTALSLETH